MPIAQDGGLDRVLLLLAGDVRLAAGATRARAADPHLSPVDPQVHAFCLGVGEYVLQRAQPQTGPVRDGKAAGRQQPAASSQRTSRTAAETVERSRPYNCARAACGSPSRRCTSVTRSRSTRTRRCLGPAPTALLRSPPRRPRKADSRAARQLGASSSSNSPKCARETPDRAGREQAARGQACVTTCPTRADLRL